MANLPSLPDEAVNALPIVQRYFGTSLVAVYLHGSAVAGGLGPNSDVDLIAIVDQPTTQDLRARLVSELMLFSAYPGTRAGVRPLELIIFRRSDLAASIYPARAEFVYGEWLRTAFEAGEVPEPSSDPEYTLVLAQARNEAKPLLGPAAAELLPIIPASDVRRAIGDALPALLASLDGDERNVLLTLARMWRTLSTGEFVSKADAAEWATARLPQAQATVLDHARRAYLGTIQDDWSCRHQEARETATVLKERIDAML